MKILSEIEHKNKIVVVNKNDLEIKIKIEEITKYIKNDRISFISAKKGQGYSKLCNKISNTIIGKNRSAESPELYLTEVRHKNSLTNSYDHIYIFNNLLDSEQSLEIMSMELRSSLDYLGEITGEVTNEDLLGKIFSKFCIGK